MMQTTWWCCAAVLAVTTTTAMAATAAAEEPPLSEKEISRNTEETVRKIHDAIDAASSTMARRRLLGNDGAPSTEVNLYESDCPKNLDDNGCEACVSAGCFWQPVARFCGKDCMIMDTSCYGVAESWSAPCPDPNAKPNDAPSSTKVNLYESDCPKNLDDNGCEACVSAGCFWQPVARFCGKDCMIMDTSCYGVAESWSAPCPDPNAKPNDAPSSTKVNLYESDCPKNLDDNGCEACVSAGCFWQPVARFCGKDCMIMDTSCYGVAESWSAPCLDPNAKPNDAPSSTKVNLYESDCPKNLDDNGCEACVSAGCFWQPVDRFCGKDCMIMDTSCYGVAESWSAPCPDPNATKPTNSGR